MISNRQRNKTLAVLVGCFIVYLISRTTFEHSSPKKLSHTSSGKSGHLSFAQIKADAERAALDAMEKGDSVGEDSALDMKTIMSIRDYSIFFHNLEDFDPKSDSLKGKYKTDKAKELFSNGGDFLFSKEYLENVLDVPDETVTRLKDSHTRYVDQQINRLVENSGVSTFGNILESDPEWSTYQGSSGYVLIGGGEYSWLSFLVIKQIRATGSKLPIELFLPGTNDYEKDYCEKLLPKFNARCNVFDDNLAADLKKRFNLGGYQYKMLAILSSKFENILYLDSDGFPTKDLDYLFESDLYKEKNMIIWPDAWARTTNPKFYDIASHTVTEKKLRYSSYDKKQAEKKDTKVKELKDYDFTNSNYHDFEGAIPDPTSETGILMINKTSHMRTLLLCLYYNVFGPHFYYPLMTQGSAGEGDKETFIAAAIVMGEPWFQTLKQFHWTGYIKEDSGKFDSKALGHYDPVQSSKMTKDDEEIDYCFMHLSYPKFYPNWLADNHDLVYEKSGKHIRMYKDIYKNVGYDFDLRVLQFFVQGLCPSYYDKDGAAVDGSSATRQNDYVGKYLKYVSDREQEDEARCKDIFIPHLKWLKETTKVSMG
ncbi:alpha-1,2-mannosyltransferase Mnn2p [[Candida] anglica]